MNLTSIMERDLLIEAGRMFVIAKSGIFLSRQGRPDGRNNKTNRTGGREGEREEEDKLDTITLLIMSGTAWLLYKQPGY